MTTHFSDDTTEGHTLCGERWNVVVWSNDPRAACGRCQDVWSHDTGWAFPLPELVEEDR